jgi:hypothetical protein
MRKKEVIWIGVLLVLGGVYIHFFTHWFRKREIDVVVSARLNRQANPPFSMTLFTLNDKYKLTKLKVIPLDGEKFNPLAIPVWDLDSESNSVPTKTIRYGQRIHGMKSVVKDTLAVPLTPGAFYRLMLTAGDATACKDFKMQNATE